MDLASFFYRFGKLSVFVFALGASFLLAFFLVSRMIFNPIDAGSKEKISFIVYPNQTVEQVFQDLVKVGIAHSTWSLNFIKDFKNETRTIKVGEYILSKNYSTAEILDTLFSGGIVYRHVTIPPGARLDEITSMIVKTGLVTEERFNNAAVDSKLLTQLQIRDNNLEGYLFPKQYSLSRPIKAEDIIIIMVNELRTQFTSSMLERAIDLGLNDHLVLTLASIIQKEGKQPQDLPRISSVYHNRLRINMPLQSASSLRYGLKKFDEILSDEDRRTQTPYNTYLKEGLPPGPIGSPSLDAIVAALYPEDTAFLYFFELPDGGMHFSSSLREHEAAQQAAIAGSTSNSDGTIDPAEVLAQ